MALMMHRRRIYKSIRPIVSFANLGFFCLFLLILALFVPSRMLIVKRDGERKTLPELTRRTKTPLTGEVLLHSPTNADPS